MDPLDVECRWLWVTQYGWWEANSGPLQDQQTFLTTVLNLQCCPWNPHCHFKRHLLKHHQRRRQKERKSWEIWKRARKCLFWVGTTIAIMLQLLWLPVLGLHKAEPSKPTMSWEGLMQSHPFLMNYQEMIDSGRRETIDSLSSYLLMSLPDCSGQFSNPWWHSPADNYLATK